jgi:hypothetical protein
MSSPTAAKGMIHRETILADGSVANTRVSARTLKKQSSKRQRTGPHFPPAEDDECKSMDEDGDDDDFSSLSTLQSEMFPNAGPEMTVMNLMKERKKTFKKCIHMPQRCWVIKTSPRLMVPVSAAVFRLA